MQRLWSREQTHNHLGLMQCHEKALEVCLQDTLWTSLIARNMLPACYGPAGRPPPPPGKADIKSKRKLPMTSLFSVSGRGRVLASRTVGCREQPSSAQGWLERVLEASTRSRTMAWPNYELNWILQPLAGVLIGNWCPGLYGVVGNHS